MKNFTELVMIDCNDHLLFQIFQSLLDAGIKAGIYHGQMGGTAREKSHRFFFSFIFVY